MNKEITIYELLGLIKDGNAPKKIKFSHEIFVFTDGRYKQKDNISEDNSMLGDYFRLDGMLNDIVKILDEENDEFEDIEEINEEALYEDDKVMNTINQLIRNQKKIIERLNKENG